MRDFDINSIRGGDKAIQRFQAAHKKRLGQYPLDPLSISKHLDVINNLYENGYYIWRDAISPEIILSIAECLNNTLSKKSNLVIRDPPHFAKIKNPLEHCDSAAEVATSNLIVEIATAYFECMPAIGTTNLRKSYVNDEPPTRTSLFHSDKNSIRFLKFFFYLNDVDIDGGPFTYVQGSHQARFKGWTDKYRYTYEEMITKYDKKDFIYLTAKVGDMIIANTTGFHRGTKPKHKNRMMLTINYVIHPEGDNINESISHQVANALPAHQKPIIDFLKVC